MEDAYVTKSTLERKTREWLRKIAPYKQPRMRFSPNKAALLVIDMQNFFLSPDSPTYTCGGAAVLPNVKKLVKAFRKAGRPVVFTRHVHHPARLDAGIMDWWWEGMCLEGTPESEIPASLAPRPSEKVVLKHRYSAFYNTDLETVLRCLEVRQLVVTGVMTNLCCESTARDAYFRDFQVFFPADATATVSEEMHVASLLNLAFGFALVTSTGRLLRRFGP